jgi:hypothetical protein
MESPGLWQQRHSAGADSSYLTDGRPGSSPCLGSWCLVLGGFLVVGAPGAMDRCTAIAAPGTRHLPGTAHQAPGTIVI